MRSNHLWFLRIFLAFVAYHIQRVTSFVVISQTRRAEGHKVVTPLSSRFSRCSIKHTALKQEPQNRGTCDSDANNNYEDTNSYLGDDTENPSASSSASQNPDRAISIVSELKANAALFAAFAYGSLNLPSTLTVSESKVTSVTTSLSISRPLPDSDLIRSFVVLDVCTLCLMISCVAASQLLIYRLTDGSYEDFDENYGDASEMNSSENYNGSKRRKNSRESALGRLVTTYRNEFTVARLTFDLGLVTLLFSVGVRSLAIFDEDIALPVEIVIGITAVFLAVAYITAYIEVFRTAENLTARPFFPLPFLAETKTDGAKDNVKSADGNGDADRKTPKVSTIFLPISLTLVGVALYFVLISDGSDSSVLNLSRLGPYDVTSGATKLKVVTEKIDSEKAKSDTKLKKKPRSNSLVRQSNASKKERVKAASVGKRKRLSEAEEKKKSEEDAKKKTEEGEEDRKRLEKETTRIGEEEVDAASATAKAK